MEWSDGTYRHSTSASAGRGVAADMFPGHEQDRLQGCGQPDVDRRWDASTSPDVAGYNVRRALTGWVGDSAFTDGSAYYYLATASVSGEERKKTPAIKVSIPE
jgi:hypothetical protein